MSDLYVLDADGVPRRETDVDAWGSWFVRADAERIVAREEIGGVTVSTVFLGMDHDWSGEGPPVLWETLVFDGELDGEMDRYRSREAAVAGHAAMVARVRGSLERDGEGHADRR